VFSSTAVQLNAKPQINKQKRVIAEKQGCYQASEVWHI
jgi:hypothetical protein